MINIRNTYNYDEQFHRKEFHGVAFFLTFGSIDGSAYRTFLIDIISLQQTALFLVF